MRKQIKQKITNESKNSFIPIIEKKINLVTPIYLPRKININNVRDKKSPKNINIPKRENNPNFSIKSKNSNQSTKNSNMNSIETNRSKEAKNKNQRINYANIGFISETLSRILNKKRDNNKITENTFLLNKKIGKNKKNYVNENKENIRNNYNDKTNININLNNYNNINKLENNLNLNDMIQGINLHTSLIQRNNYIKKKIINFYQNKIDNSNDTNTNGNVYNLNNIRKAKQTDRIHNMRKKISNLINSDDNSLGNRVIHDYSTNNYNYNNNNSKRYIYDNSFGENATSLQKRRISFYDFINTPDNSKHYINYRKNDNSENRVTNSCYLDNILSFRRVRPKIFYKSPFNKSQKVNLQIGKIIRDFSESKHDYNYKKKSFVLNANLIKYPSSRDTTFKKLNIKKNLEFNHKNPNFSLNYTNTDSIDNMSLDSRNKKNNEKIKKHSMNGQKNCYYLKIKKDIIPNNTKTIKEYTNKDYINYIGIGKGDKRNNNNIIYGKINYKYNDKDQFKKILKRNTSNLNNRLEKEKESNLLDYNDKFIRIINNKEFSLVKKIKKLSKSTSSLHNKKTYKNDKLNLDKKTINKIRTPKKSEDKILINASIILPNTLNKGENKKEKKDLKLSVIKNDKNDKNNSNDISNATTSHKYSKTTSNSSFIINEEARITNINTINDNIKIKIYEEEKIFDFNILYTLESKLKVLLMKINKYQICYNECQDFLSYFFGINFYEKELSLFNSEQNKNKMIYFIKFEIICYLMCYDISFNKNYSQTSILLKTIFNLLHKNYLILISYIIKTINENENEKNDNKEKNNNFNNNNYIEQMIIIKKLQEVIKNGLKMNLGMQDMNELAILQIFSDNFKQINNYYEMIIENVYSNLDEANSISFDINNAKKNFVYYKFPNCLKLNMIKINDKKKCYIISEFFNNALKSIDSYCMKELKLFFNLYLNKSTDNVFIQQYYNYKRIYSLIPCPPLSPILNSEKKILPPINEEKYNYTLILDLDETLIYLEKEYYTFNNIHNIKNKKLTLRPGLFNFLDRMKKIYEIILFSFSPPDYSFPIIELIEKDEKYFEHILYIQQASYNNGDYVKSIDSLGRNIKNTIIIDDNINNVIKSNRDNVICIKPFYGDISNEKNILQLLGNILNKIRYDAEITGDIRKSLIKENYNIITEISSNLEE